MNLAALAFLIGLVAFAPALIPIAILPITFVNIYLELRKESIPQASKQDLRLLEDENDPDFCLVSVKIYREEKLVGEDRGVAWFSEGQLLFNGHRTSFVLGGEDVLPRKQWPIWPGRQGETSLSDQTVPLRVKEGRATVELTPMVLPKEAANPSNGKHFLKQLGDFRQHPPASTGPRQWPPFEA